MKAFAKINVGLKIINKRNDGFHNIETIFYPIKLFDEIFIDASPNNKKCVSVRIKFDKIHIPSDKNNSCYKIIESFYRNFQIKEYFLFSIRIKKNIPVGGGLGGGSTDAASVLRYLINHFRIDISANREKIIETALNIGSDIPFFLINKPCFAKGRGEILRALPDFNIPYIILLVNPNIHISTKWAYENMNINVGKYQNTELNSIKNFDIAKKDLYFNDFEKIVFNKYKILEKLKNEFYENGAVFSSLSGSGATMYAFFKLSSIKNVQAIAKTFIKKGFFVYIN